MKLKTQLKVMGLTLLMTSLLSGCNEQQVLSEPDDTNGMTESVENRTINNTANGQQSESQCEPTERQAKMLQLVNEARTQARSCGDDYYEAAGSMTWNCKLEQAAWNHTDDMVKYNFFSHTGSDGLKAGARIDEVGYNWRVYGENLAAGFTLEEDALQGLLDSPGHCKNIMNPKFKEFGSARKFPQSNDYISYWTHVFGTLL